jgi:hypothetical protein
MNLAYQRVLPGICCWPDGGVGRHRQDGVGGKVIGRPGFRQAHRVTVTAPNSVDNPVRESCPAVWLTSLIRPRAGSP